MVIFGVFIVLSIQIPTLAVADATAQSIDNLSDTGMNNTTTIDPSSEIAAMTAAFGEPFYELKDTIDTGNEVVDLEPQQTKDSYVGQGYMKGIGNITEYGTYTTTYSSPIVSSIGKGIIFDNDKVVATYTAQDTGRYDNEGNLFSKGTMFFQSDDASINEKVGLYLYWQDNNGTDWSRTWSWE